MKIARSLQNEIIISFVLLTLVPAIVGVGLAFVYARSSLQTSAEDNLRSSVQLKQLTVEQWYRRHAYDLQLLENAPLLQSRLIPPSQAELTEKVSKLVDTESFLGIWQLDEQGDVWRALLGDEQTEVPLEEPLSFGDAKLFAVQALPNGESVIPIQVPLRSRWTQDHMGSLLGYLRVQSLSQLMQAGVTEGDERTMYLLDSEQRILAHPVTALATTTVNIPVLESCQRDGQGIDSYQNANNVSVLAAYLWLDFPRSCLLVEQSVDVALGAAEQEMRLLLLGLIGVISVFAILAARFVAGRLVQPIHELMGAVKRLAEGDFSGKPAESTLIEIQRLNRAFIDMSTSLETYNRYLEERVAQRTLELSERNLQLHETMAELEQERKKQLQQAYSAGMIEHAISVLHNIGNAITPLIVRTQQMKQNIEKSPTPVYLQQICGLLQDNQSNLGEFFASPRGQQVLPFLQQLSDTTKQQQKDDLLAMDKMNNQLAHITEIIALQQKYAQRQGIEEEFQIADVIDDALEMMEPALEKRHLTIDKQIEPNLPPLRNDMNKLMQLFMNLIKNSMESIDEQTLQAGSEFKGNITIIAENTAEGMMRCSVRDNGKGAAPAALEHAFEFGYSTKKRGSGFGLHDCANFVRSNKGQIELQSEGEGKGACISFTLPTQLSKAA